MAILNRDCSCNVLITICDALAHLGAAPREKVIELCMSGIVETQTNKTRTPGTISHFLTTGFLVEEKDKLYFHKDYTYLADFDTYGRLTQLPGALRKAIFSFADTKLDKRDFWSDKPDGAIDIVRALSWLLSQDIYKTELKWDPIDKLEASQFTSERVIQNDTRLNPALEWSAFLGFMDQADTDKGRFDPTQAVKETLDEIFVTKPGKLNAADFLSSLSKQLPVLDDGRFRKTVEDAMTKKKGWVPPPRGSLSTSLSIALRRLMLDPDLTFRLNNPADAGEKFKLSLGEDNDLEFSVVTLGELQHA